MTVGDFGHPRPDLRHAVVSKHGTRYFTFVNGTLADHVASSLHVIVIEYYQGCRSVETGNPGKVPTVRIMVVAERGARAW